MTDGLAAAGTPNPVVQVGWKMAAAFAAVLILFLGVGVLLPGTWSAEARRVLAAPPAEVFALLDHPRRWEAWTPLPEVSFTFEGPERGVGATRSWDDPRVGQGTFRIVESEPPRLLRYRVEVEGGDLVTEGTLRLEPAPEGTLVSWREDGDFGWNPLLGWAARRMGEVQAAELEKALERLDAASRTR